MSDEKPLVINFTGKVGRNVCRAFMEAGLRYMEQRDRSKIRWPA
jgi:hypothetical protein